MICLFFLFVFGMTLSNQLGSDFDKQGDVWYNRALHQIPNAELHDRPLIHLW